MTGFYRTMHALLMTLFASLAVIAPLQNTAAQQQALAETSQDHPVTALDISVAVFDPGIPADPSTHRDLQIFPEIREIESLFLPFVLRATLMATREWGAVRVVPQPELSSELQVSGTILQSDGETLVLHVRAVDASGRIWIDKTYKGVDKVSSGRAAAKPGMSGYQPLYDEIAADLRVVRSGMDSKTLGDITEIAMLRYAENLVPSAYSGYLRASPENTFSILRLPAKGDPIFARIERIRNVEFVLTDAVDIKFKELHAEIAPTYDLWRKYRRQFYQYQLDEAMHQATRRTNDPPGSFEAIKRSYDNYKWSRLAEQEQDSWAEGFNNEVTPQIKAMATRVDELEGWVDERYAEWDRMLSELFLLETGLDE